LIEAQNIQLQVEDSKVTVRGTVASGHKHDIVLPAAKCLRNQGSSHAELNVADRIDMILKPGIC
jgi:hypothetical protein